MFNTVSVAAPPPLPAVQPSVPTKLASTGGLLWDVFLQIIERPMHFLSGDAFAGSRENFESRARKLISDQLVGQRDTPRRVAGLDLRLRVASPDRGPEISFGSGERISIPEVVRLASQAGVKPNDQGFVIQRDGLSQALGDRQSGLYRQMVDASRQANIKVEVVSDGRSWTFTPSMSNTAPPRLQKVDRLTEAPSFEFYDMSPAVNALRTGQLNGPAQLARSVQFTALDGTVGRVELKIASVKRFDDRTAVEIEAKFGSKRNKITLLLSDRSNQIDLLDFLKYGQDSLAGLGMGHQFMSFVKEIAMQSGKKIEAFPVDDTQVLKFYQDEGFTLKRDGSALWQPR